MMNPTTTTFRDMVYTISPSWLRGPIGSRFMYSMAICLDALSDSTAYAVRARFPDLAPPDAYPYLANDRQIEQGFQEPVASWVSRTTQWLDRWAKVGSAWGVLMAIRGYVAPDVCRVAVVTNLGTWNWYAAGDPADPSHPPQRFQPGTWTWDTLSFPWLSRKGWFRVWVIIYPSPSTWQQTAQKFGDGSVWGDGKGFGWTGTLAQANGLQAVVKKWKTANAWIPWIILSWDPDAFLPSGADASPDGYYGTWSKVITASNGRPQYVPSRYAGAAYLDGVT